MDTARIARISVPDLTAETGRTSIGAAPAADFKGLVREGFDRLGRLEAEAAGQAQSLMRGEPVELHRVVLAGEQAGLAFDLMLSVRNKVVEAYQEVMRMQV